jgi:hypothetical protein
MALYVSSAPRKEWMISPLLVHLKKKEIVAILSYFLNVEKCFDKLDYSQNMVHVYRRIQWEGKYCNHPLLECSKHGAP